MKLLICSFIISFIYPALAHAHNWEQYDIPGAYCGNGEPYSVFFDRKSVDKLTIEFEGGGVCWSELSCYGQTALVSLKPLSEPTPDLVTSEDESSPWARHSVLYFPYCTADVFAGNHIGSYVPMVPLYHYGYQNILLALQFLQHNGLVEFSAVTDLLLWGASAGAIGSFVHAENIEKMIAPKARKTLISDSPGLHFGNNFWYKFPSQTNRDFQENFGKMGLVYSLNDGLIAARMGPVFTKLQGWSVGILQATKDPAMSLLYGGITPSDHRRLVLGPSGIVEVAKGYPQVNTWVADMAMHTFLLRRFSGEYRSMQGETAWNFAVRVYSNQILLAPAASK